MTPASALAAEVAALEKPLQFGQRQADISEDAPERSLGDVSPGMDGDRRTAPIRVAQNVMASRDPHDLEPGPL
jgi:hypothetical protein